MCDFSRDQNIRQGMSNLTEIHTAPLFKPFSIKNLDLSNRIVMAPMTRSKSPAGIPGPDVAAYYRRRAEGGVGLIITEGTYVPHPAAGFYPDVPRFYGEESLAGWKCVVEEVHRAGGQNLSPDLARWSDASCGRHISAWRHRSFRTCQTR